MRPALLGLLIYGRTDALDALDREERIRVLALDQRLDLVAALTSGVLHASSPGG